MYKLVLFGEFVMQIYTKYVSRIKTRDLVFGSLDFVSDGGQNVYKLVLFGEFVMQIYTKCVSKIKTETSLSLAALTLSVTEDRMCTNSSCLESLLCKFTQNV